VLVDSHTHVGAAEHYSPEFRADLTRSWPEMRTAGWDLESHRQAMERVDRAIVLAFDAPAAGLVVPNEYVAEGLITRDALTVLGIKDPGGNG
jgi:imidazolonepropionase-like amidohydrolase